MTGPTQFDKKLLLYLMAWLLLPV